MATGAVPQQFTRFVPIEKVDPEQRMVWGYASTPSLDSQGERVSVKAIEAALPEYMRFGNVREMHRASAVGKTKSAEVDENGLYIGAKVVDDAAWEKVKEGVYGGFSIGGRVTEKVDEEIRGLDLVEISLVDRPANPDAIFDVWKSETPPNTEAPTEEQDPPNTDTQDNPPASEKESDTTPASSPEPTNTDAAGDVPPVAEKGQRMSEHKLGDVTLDLQKAGLPSDATALDFVKAAYDSFDKVKALEADNRKLLDALKGYQDATKKLKEAEADALVKGAIADDKIDAADAEFYRELFAKDAVLCTKRIQALPSRKYLRIRQGLDNPLDLPTDPEAELAEKVADVMAANKDLTKAQAVMKAYELDPTLFPRLQKAKQAKASKEEGK